MKIFLLASAFLFCAHLANAADASFIFSCNTLGGSASEVVAFTLDGVHFTPENLQVADQSVEILHDQVVLQSNDGTRISLGSVIAKGTCGADKNLTVEIAMDPNVQLNEGLLTQADCHAIDFDHQFAVDQAFKIQVSSGTQVIALETEYTSVFPTLAACRASYR